MKEARKFETKKLKIETMLAILFLNLDINREPQLAGEELLLKHAFGVSAASFCRRNKSNYLFKSEPKSNSELTAWQ